MFYEIPANLSSEIAELDGYIGAFRRGELDAASLKSRRVPFGCYEQRRDGAYMVRIRATGGAVTPVAALQHRLEFDGLSIEHLQWQLPYGPPTEALLLKPAGALD